MYIYPTITSFETRAMIENYDMTFVLRRIKERDTKKYESGWRMRIKTDNKHNTLNPNPWILAKVIYEIFKYDDDETPINYIDYEYKKERKKKTISFTRQLNCDEIREKLLKKGYGA